MILLVGVIEGVTDDVGVILAVGVTDLVGDTDGVLLGVTDVEGVIDGVGGIGELDGVGHGIGTKLATTV